MIHRSICAGAIEDVMAFGPPGLAFARHTRALNANKNSRALPLPQYFLRRFFSFELRVMHITVLILA